MCGRFTHMHSWPEVHSFVSLEPLRGPVTDALFRPHYNVAPTQIGPVARVGHDGVAEIVSMRWGLVPSWAKDAKRAPINAPAGLAQRERSSAARARSASTPTRTGFSGRTVRSVDGVQGLRPQRRADRHSDRDGARELARDDCARCARQVPRADPQRPTRRAAARRSRVTHAQRDLRDAAFRAAVKESTFQADQAWRAWVVTQK